MSLINEALKKAQRERSTNPGQPIGVPPVGMPPPAGGAAGYRQPKSNPWPAVLVVLALVGGGTAVWFLKPGPASVPQSTATGTVSSLPATPPTIAQSATTDSNALPAQTPPAQLQINLPPSPAAPPPVATAPAPAPVAVVPAPQAATPPTTPEPLKITLQMEDPRVLAFLDAARINGVRSVADDAKLLMNNKVFRAGAVVDRELGLKLMQILPSELVFEDARGIQYRKAL